MILDVFDVLVLECRRLYIYICSSWVVFY